MTDIFIQIPQLKQQEGSSFTATAYGRNGQTAEAPTTAKYRLDCLTTGTKLTDWTTLTPAASMAISITSTENAIQDQSNRFEKKQLTVAANPDTATQYRAVAIWKVENIRNV